MPEYQGFFGREQASGSCQGGRKTEGNTVLINERAACHWILKFRPIAYKSMLSTNVSPIIKGGELKGGTQIQLVFKD